MLIGEGIAKEHVKEKQGSPIKQADYKAFSAILDYYDDRLKVSDIFSIIEPAIMYQRMLNHALEIFENDLMVDDYSMKDICTKIVRKQLTI